MSKKEHDEVIPGGRFLSVDAYRLVQKVLRCSE
jgi:hypothetical protein